MIAGTTGAIFIFLSSLGVVYDRQDDTSYNRNRRHMWEDVYLCNALYEQHHNHHAVVLPSSFPTSVNHRFTPRPPVHHERICSTVLLADDASAEWT
jgi:hypothetical protein